MSTKKSENETYKTLISEIKRLSADIDILTKKRKRIRCILYKNYTQCYKCGKHFNRLYKKNWASIESNDGNKSYMIDHSCNPISVTVKCPYCGNEQKEFIYKTDKNVKCKVTHIL